MRRTLRIAPQTLPQTAPNPAPSTKRRDSGIQGAPEATGRTSRQPSPPPFSFKAGRAERRRENGPPFLPGPLEKRPPRAQAPRAGGALSLALSALAGRLAGTWQPRVEQHHESAQDGDAGTALDAQAVAPDGGVRWAGDGEVAGGLHRAPGASAGGAGDAEVHAGLGLQGGRRAWREGKRPQLRAGSGGRAAGRLPLAAAAASAAPGARPGSADPAEGGC